MEAEQSADRPEGEEKGVIYQFQGSRGVVLQLRLLPDGSVALGTFNSTDPDSKLYALILAEGARMTLANLLIDKPQDGMVN